MDEGVLSGEIFIPSISTLNLLSGDKWWTSFVTRSIKDSTVCNVNNILYAIFNHSLELFCTFHPYGICVITDASYEENINRMCAEMFRLISGKDSDNLPEADEMEKRIKLLLGNLISKKFLDDLVFSHKNIANLSYREAKSSIYIYIFNCKLCNEWEACLTENGPEEHFSKNHPHVNKKIFVKSFRSGITGSDYVDKNSQCVLCDMKFIDPVGGKNTVPKEPVDNHIIDVHCAEDKYKILIPAVLNTYGSLLKDIK